MSEWHIELEFIDDKSKKFWRARTDGEDFVVNYGRIGTGGQTKTKSMGSADKASAEMEKVANSKRKKGYADAGGAAPEPAVDNTPEVKDKKAKYKATRAGKTVEVEIETDGATIETEIEETLASPEAAAAAFDKIVESLVAAGYSKA
jgi:predicted DNA-binding WGR domain protein